MDAEEAAVEVPVKSGGVGGGGEGDDDDEEDDDADDEIGGDVEVNDAEKDDPDEVSTKDEEEASELLFVVELEAFEEVDEVSVPLEFVVLKRRDDADFFDDSVVLLFKLAFLAIKSFSSYRDLFVLRLVAVQSDEELGDDVVNA